MQPNIIIQTFDKRPLSNPDFLSVLNAIYTLEQLVWKNNEDVADNFLLRYWIMYQNKIPIARACLYENPKLNWDEKAVPCIGNFECIEDIELAQILLSTIEQYACSKGFSGIIGPMNGSTFGQYRFPVTTIDEPFFSEEFYPEYYAVYWKLCGYKTIGAYYSSKAILKKELIEYSIFFSQESSVNFRMINLNDFEIELRRIHELICACFVHNKFYTPVALQIFLDQYLSFKEYIDPNFFWLAEKANKTIAIIFCFSDKNNLSNLVIKTILVHPAFRSKGIMQQLGKIIYSKAFDAGFSTITHAYMHQHNGSVSLSKKFGGTVFRTYELYGKHF